MNRDFFTGAYMQLTELQPARTYHQFDLTQTPTAATSSYEMTVGAAPEAGSALAAMQPVPLHQQQQHDPRKRRASNFGDAFDSMSGCDGQMAASSNTLMAAPSSRKRKTSTYADGFDSMSGCDGQMAASSNTLMAAPASRKRKTSSYGTVSAYDDNGEDSRSTRTIPDKKQNHSEIEKRRRDKMNTYISELSAMVPMCGAMARKLDKLTVLRMAVQHLRTVRGALSACPLTARPRPAFVSERELNALILDAAQDSFLLVVGCDRGRLLYVSASVTNILLYDQAELVGQSMFDILHPKDVAKVKEQLSSSDLSPRERLIDAKTMLPVKADVSAAASRFCPGARRSFFCRIKCKTPPHNHLQTLPVKEETEPGAKLRKKQNEKKYCVVQCTGYLKSWAPAEMSESGVATEGGEDEACNLSCLVAVGRALPDLAAPSPPPQPLVPPTRCLQFVSRHAIDGKYLFVDQRVTLVLGFLPQELLGTSLYEYVTGPELAAVARTHKAALVRRHALRTPPYSLKRKDGSHARLQTYFKPFRNPWTKDVECLVAQNTLVSETQSTTTDGASGAFAEVPHQKGDIEVQRLIDSQVESHKIGSAIAEEALRRSSADYSPELPADLLQDAVFNHQALVDNLLCTDMAYQVRNNVPLSAAGARSPSETSAGATASMGTEGDCVRSPPSISPPMTLDGNGEAAMAVIMSLLEADAGLGGPVNFSGLPWPLP